MKRNLFLFLLLFLFTLTASVIEISGHLNIQKEIQRLKTNAVSVVKQELKDDCKEPTHLLDQDSPMVLRLTYLR